MIYCHGIGNKPAESTLRSEWNRALFGFDQGERTRMAYWVDRERYPKPEIRLGFGIAFLIGMIAGFSERLIPDIIDGFKKKSSS